MIIGVLNYGNNTVKDGINLNPYSFFKFADEKNRLHPPTYDPAQTNSKSFFYPPVYPYQYPIEQSTMSTALTEELMPQKRYKKK